MSKKKVIIIIAVLAVVLAASGGAIWYFLIEGNKAGGSSADKVYVESVASLTSAASGAQNRYSGVVEPQETLKVNKDSGREVKELLVKEGDAVEVGTPLFEYDTEEIKAELQQAKLELEGIQNSISGYQEQINQMTQEKNAAPEEDKYQYTAGIQNLQNDIKQAQVDIESKKIEMQKKEESIGNAVVTSEMAGVVKSINENGSSDGMGGEEEAYITILATGDYRVKGSISEQSISTLSEGQPVIIRSRIDEDQTWKGSISKVDTQNQISNNNDMYMGGGEDSQTSAKYPFYITLESTDDLLLGQHVYIELDQGQSEKKEGMWLFEGYIVKEKKEAYVWAANKKNKLEKRKVELGEYDEELSEYEIKSGLKKEDAIAFPMEGLYEGVATVTDMEEIDYTSPLYNKEGEEGGAAELPEGEEGGETKLPEGEEGTPEEGGETKLLDGMERMPEEGGETIPLDDGEIMNNGNTDSLEEPEG